MAAGRLLTPRLRAGGRANGEIGTGLPSHDRFAPAGHRHGLGLHPGTQAVEASVQRFRRPHVQLRGYGDRLQDRQRISLRVGDWARVRNGACHWHCRLRLPAAHGRPRRRRPAFKGSVDAIGVGVSYTRLINKTPLVFNLRQHHDFDAENRWQGDATIASATLRW